MFLNYCKICIFLIEYKNLISHNYIPFSDLIFSIIVKAWKKISIVAENHLSKLAFSHKMQYYHHHQVNWKLRLTCQTSHRFSHLYILCFKRITNEFDTSYKILYCYGLLLSNRSNHRDIQGRENDRNIQQN